MSPKRLLRPLLAAAGVSGIFVMLILGGVPKTMILYLVIGLLVSMVAAIAAWARKSRKKGGGIEDALKAQSEREAASYTPDRKAEIDRMQESFDQALAQLKASNLGGEGRFGKGKKALYALPWYLMVGPPGAGKTTALLKSGLRFPAGAERIKGVGGTRNCDWFFTDEAILVDTAGRYTTEDEDRDEWNAFLDALKDSRPDRPINGIMVAISAQDLLGDELDLEDHADNIRRRVDELVQRLGLRLPVYLVITKTDLIPGFVEFFGELDRDGREQIWGATVEPYSTADPAEVVEREFDGIMDALRPHRNARLSRNLRREERQRVYDFPLELASMRDRLARFSSVVFAPNPLSEGPLFRGFYFTSGTQEGAPIDRVIGALAQQFGLRTPPPPRAPSEPKSYFLKDVFTDVVFPDRFIARRTKKAAGATWRAMTRTGLAALGTAALIAILLGFAGARSNAQLRGVLEAGDRASGVTFNPAGARFDDVNRLEGLREEVARLEDASPLSRTLMLGLGRGSTVREPAQDLYYMRARDLVSVYAMRQLRASLQEAQSLNSPDTSATAGASAASRRAARRVEIEEDLKAYLLLTTNADSLASDEGLRDVLKARLAEIAPRAALGGGGDREAMTDIVARQTDAFVDGLAAKRVEPFDADDALIRSAIAVIDVAPSLDGLYARIRREALARLPDFGLSRAVMPQHLDLFAPARSVPGFFTREGWDRVVKRRFEQAAENPAREFWVTGRTAADLPSELRDPDAVYDALMAQYQTDYVDSWTRFMHSVRYKQANAIEAEARLAILGSTTDSPIGWFLASVTQQTTLPDEDTAPRRSLIDRARGAIGIGGEDADSTAVSNPITEAFRGIHRLNTQGLAAGSADPAFIGALEALSQFGRRIAGAAGDPGMAAELLAVTKDAVEQGTRGIDRQTRENLFFAPLDISQTGAVAAASEAAASAASEAASEATTSALAVALEAYNAKIAGRYPFSPRSDRDAALDAAREFFDPNGGDLATLAEALGDEGGSRALRAAVTKGQAIGRALFNGDLTFRLKPDLPTYSSDVAQRELAADAVAVGIHGTNDVYRLGSTRFADFRWPGQPGSFITVQRTGGPLSKEFEGDWAVFRLMDAATVRPRGGTVYDVRWSFREGQNTVTANYEMRTTSENSPLANPSAFFQFALPRSAD